jgi:hypothetical protein
MLNTHLTQIHSILNELEFATTTDVSNPPKESYLAPSPPECSGAGFCKPSESSDRYVEWLVLQSLAKGRVRPLADIQHRDRIIE